MSPQQALQLALLRRKGWRVPRDPGINVMTKVLRMRQGARFRGDTTFLNPVPIARLTTPEKKWVNDHVAELAILSQVLPPEERKFEKVLVQVYNWDRTVVKDPRRVYTHLHPTASNRKRKSRSESPRDFREMQLRDAEVYISKTKG